MHLVPRSDPTVVPSADALSLLEERLVLASAVCSELEACEDSYAHSRPAAALDLLRRWVADHYPASERSGIGVAAGLETVVVPPGAEQRMAELRAATRVCEALALLLAAARKSQFVAASNVVSDALAAWRATRSTAAGAWRRPVRGGPMLTLPEEGRALAPELAYARRSSARKRASQWNDLLRGDFRYGPNTDHVVGVGERSPEGRWPLVWQAS